MSVMKPGITSRMPASTIIAPWASSLLGSRPASISVRTRLMTPKPCTRSSIEPTTALEQHQADRRQHADFAAHHHETGDLEQRQGKKQEGQHENCRSGPGLC